MKLWAVEAGLPHGAAEGVVPEDRLAVVVEGPLACGYPLHFLAAVGALEAWIGEARLAVAFHPGAAAAVAWYLPDDDRPWHLDDDAHLRGPDGSRWALLTGRCVAGPQQGAALAPASLSVFCWRSLIVQRPHALVCPPLPFLRRLVGRWRLSRAEQARPDDPIGLGVRVGGESLFLPLEELFAEGVRTVRLGGEPVVLVSDLEPGGAQAFLARFEDVELDLGLVARGVMGCARTRLEFDLLGHLRVTDASTSTHIDDPDEAPAPDAIGPAGPALERVSSLLLRQSAWRSLLG